MKILIDIGHPAHVHYFKNFIRIMQTNGSRFMITSRNKEIAHYLLKKHNIPFLDRGKGRRSVIGKAIYYNKAVYLIYRCARKFEPDLIISFASPYAAIVSKLIRKPSIVFNDTEHAKLSHYLTDPFSQCILTPSCYKNGLGKKQIRFDGYMELSYLYSYYFTPDPSIFNVLGLSRNEKYIIIRFVSWHASHDMGHSGLDLQVKLDAVKALSKYARVFISSEGELPVHLKKYRIKIPPDRIHDALAFAALFVGEGATMASECAMLGVPAIYVNSLEVGYCTELERKYGLMFNYRNSNGVLEKALELINKPNLDEEWAIRRQRMLAEKIDVTAFMVWFVENYPESVKTMTEFPDYQRKFKLSPCAKVQRC